MLRVITLLLSFACLNAVAGYSHAVILSDSLADEGRIYALTNNEFPPEPYFEGRFSNGPTWPEYAYNARENYAYGGATSDYDNVLDPTFGELVANTGLLGQVEEYIAAHPETEDLDDTLFYIAIGGNDLLSLSDMDEDDAMRIVKTVVDNIQLAVKRLDVTGATHFAVVGLPDLSLTPAAQLLTPAQRALSSRLSQHFNEELRKVARRHALQFIDMDAFTQETLAHAGELGFTHTTEACVDVTNETMCDNPDAYFFWDDIHPTTRVHEMFAAYAVQ